MKPPRSRSRLHELTPAELRALQALADGADGHKGVAQVMGNSWLTVKDHFAAARAKLNANTTAQAVFLAGKRGLIN